MPKLLFFTKMNFGVPANHGIKKKVFAQAKAFRGVGIQTDVFYLENNLLKIEGDSLLHSYEPPSRLSYLRYLYGGFLNDVRIEEYDFVYIRHFLTNPLFTRLLKEMKRRKPSLKIVMEIPTYPYRFEFADMPLTKRLGLWLDEQTVPAFHRYIDRIVTFSDQPTIAGIPTIRTDNGIDVEQYGLLPPAAFDGQTLHLLGLANMQRWHGFDRMLTGLKLYQQSSQKTLGVHFHVVGKGGEEENLKQQAATLGLQEQVTFYGFLSGAELEAMFQKVQVGVASMGMHRINVADGQTSTLKSREYTARGLPFVYGHTDRGFPKDFPYLLQFPADESPIEVAAIVAYYQRLRTQHPDYAQILNAYARQNFTWQAKLAPVVAYLLQTNA